MASKQPKKTPKKRRSKIKTRPNPPRNPLNPEALRRDFTDPDRLQALMDHLGVLLREEPGLQEIRLPPRTLLDALDDLAESSGDELRAMDDPFRQRIAILNHTLSPMLSRRFVDRFEKALLAVMENVKRVPRHFRAVAAGLYFLEIHNRQGGEPGANPLWNLLFDISYEEAMATAGGTLAGATGSGKQSRGGKVSGPAIPGKRSEMSVDDVTRSAGKDLADGALAGDDMTGSDLSDEDAALIRDAVGLIESGRVALGFSLDTILLGLREVTAFPERSPDALAAALQAAFRKEIGMQATSDLIWGLEYAIEQLDGEKKADFTTMLRAIRVLPARENPVIFAVYFKSVTEFYKYLKPGEVEYAEAIASSRGDADTVVAFARYLLDRDVPRRALNAFIAASQIDPSHEIARLGAGIACWLTESFREARLHWDRAARLWSGYLPEDHRDIRLVRSLAELDNFAELPQIAYDRLFEASDREETL